MEIFHHYTKKAISNLNISRFSNFLNFIKQQYQAVFTIIKGDGIFRQLLVTRNFVSKIHSIKDTTSEWSFSIKSVTYLKLNKSNPYYIKVGVNSTLNKKYVTEAKIELKNKDEFEFTFKYLENKNEFLFILRKLVFENCENFLKVTY